MTKFVTLSIERLNQVIGALNSYCNTGEIDCADDLVAELLAERDQKQSEQEPVAWCALNADRSGIAYFDGRPIIMTGPTGNEHHPDPLYTKTQHKCTPLTTGQIHDIVIAVCDKIYPQDNSSYSEADSVFYGAFVRAVDEAYGIK